MSGNAGCSVREMQMLSVQCAPRDPDPGAGWDDNRATTVIATLFNRVNLIYDDAPSRGRHCVNSVALKHVFDPARAAAEAAANKSSGW